MNQTRNIVIVSDNANVNGGAAKVAISSAVELARRGWRVFFFSGVGPVASELRSAPGLSVICLGQFEILSDPNRFRAMTQGLWNAPARRSMQNLLATLAPSETVVHVHLWAKALSSSVISAGREMGFSIVFTLHDYLYSCPTGTLFNHRTQAPCTLKPMSLNCLTTNCDARNFVHKSWRVLRHGVQQQFGGFDKGFDRYIALTRHSREILGAAIPDDSRIHFIPNFVDLPACQPAPVAENRRFIFSGRLVPEKGPLLFAEAARHAGVQAVFIGDGECRERVLAANDNAAVLGWLDKSEVTRELRKARAFVLPSLWYEAQPLVLLEAAAHGVPIIIPDQCAARDAVEDGVTGLWFRTGDAADLEQKIRVLEDPKIAARLGSAAFRRYWADPPTLQKHVNRLEELYRDVLGPATEKPPAHLTSLA